MAPLPIIANTYRVALHWRESVTGQIAVNVIHVQLPASTAAHVAALVDSSFVVNMWEPVITTAAIDDIAVTPLDGTGVTVHRVPTGHVVGGTAGQFEPAASAVVSFSTSHRGRSHRGRFYTPFITEASLANGSLGGTYPADMQTAWETFNANLETDPGVAEHVVASYKLATADEVESYRVLAAVGTQRRRQSRVRYP
jgi:hypothetical protein